MRIVHSFLTLSVIAAGAALSGGCVENRATMYIENVLAQDPSSEDCDTSPPGEFYNPRGTYDPGYWGPYVAHLVVANQMMPLGNNNTLRSETSRIQLEGAEVHIPGVDDYTVQLAATIHPDPSTNPGYATIPVPLMPPDTEPGAYEVSIKVFGTTLGNQEVESGEFVFPIDVYPAGIYAYCGTRQDMSDAEVPLEACNNFGQDDFLYACAPGQPQPPGCEEAGCPQ